MNSLSENTNHNSITTHSDSNTSHFITTDSHEVITENEKYKGPKIVIDKDCRYVTSALPYANGQIHLGHIASTYLPADIFTRFVRLTGSKIYHICATDDYGTPILIKV